MTNFCTITPSRGDRNTLLSFVMDRIDAPFKLAVIEQPTSNDIDLVARIRHGVERAKEKGYDFVFIAEDDDYYPIDYFRSQDISDCDFFGYSDTTYYNLKNRSWQTFEHPSRASLFCTGFRISALDKFDWPQDNFKWLDIKLWEYAHRHDKRIKLLPGNPTLGIKGHGMGKVAGKGHVMLMKNRDHDLSFLKSRVDESAFEFYGEIMK